MPVPLFTPVKSCMLPLTAASDRQRSQRLTCKMKGVPKASDACVNITLPVRKPVTFYGVTICPSHKRSHRSHALASLSFEIIFSSRSMFSHRPMARRSDYVDFFLRHSCSLCTCSFHKRTDSTSDLRDDTCDKRPQKTRWTKSRTSVTPSLTWW